MPRENFPHLEPGCPWYELSEIRIPNVKWCEAQVCGWVVEPFNTWTNLSYIFFSLWMAYFARTLKSRMLRMYAPCTLIVGVSSFVYHMSYTFLLQVFDFLGMFVFCFLVMMVNLTRLGHWSKRRPIFWYWGMVIGFTILTVIADFIDLPFQGLILFLVLSIIATELRCMYLRKKTNEPAYSTRFFWTAMVVQAFAAFFSASDVTRAICDPHNHWFQGHGAWHILSSIALFLIFLHHRQFDDRLKQLEDELHPLSV